MISLFHQKITKMCTYFPDLSVHDFQLKGFVVDSPLFDSVLALKAKESSAKLKWNSPPLSLILRGVKF